MCDFFFLSHSVFFYLLYVLLYHSIMFIFFFVVVNFFVFGVHPVPTVKLYPLIVCYLLVNLHHLVVICCCIYLNLRCFSLNKILWCDSTFEKRIFHFIILICLYMYIWMSFQFYFCLSKCFPVSKNISDAVKMYILIVKR